MASKRLTVHHNRGKAHPSESHYSAPGTHELTEEGFEAKMDRGWKAYSALYGHPLKLADIAAWPSPVKAEQEARRGN